MSTLSLPLTRPPAAPLEAPRRVRRGAALRRTVRALARRLDGARLDLTFDVDLRDLAADAPNWLAQLTERNDD